MIISIGVKKRKKQPEKPFSGKLNLRMKQELHARLASLAQQNRTSLYSFINECLEKAVCCVLEYAKLQLHWSILQHQPHSSIDTNHTPLALLQEHDELRKLPLQTKSLREEFL